jgi:hypothetical protein
MTDEHWNFERIQRIIVNGVEEIIHLDYKGAGSLATIPHPHPRLRSGHRLFQRPSSQKQIPSTSSQASSSKAR